MPRKDALITELRQALKKAIEVADAWCDDSHGCPCPEADITPRMRDLAAKTDPADLAALSLRIIHAASGYKMGLTNVGFAETYGGTDKLRDDLFALVEKWEDGD